MYMTDRKCDSAWCTDHSLLLSSSSYFVNQNCPIVKQWTFESAINAAKHIGKHETIVRLILQTLMFMTGQQRVCSNSITITIPWLKCQQCVTSDVCSVDERSLELLKLLITYCWPVDGMHPLISPCGPAP